MFISEDFLSFVWLHANFDHRNLKTIDGQSVSVLFPGYLNSNAGPDFLDAKIKINTIVWAGAVELHMKASDWMVHKHQDNSDYDRVILHVVWINDTVIHRQDGSEIPSIELRSRVSEDLISRYQNLIFHSGHQIACETQIQNVKNITVMNMIQKAMMQRLERKSIEVDRLLNECGNHWEEVAYRMLMKNFGFKVNQENMLLLSKFVPLKVVLRLRKNVFQLESLFFGMAGFLSEKIDSYQVKLQKEYEYLKHKYNLEQEFMQRYQWKFLRLRPQNFPTVRIAQMAVMLSRFSSIFSFILEADPDKIVSSELDIMQSEYWCDHYDFGKRARNKIAGIGISSKLNLLINTVVPVLSAYSRYTGDQGFIDKAVQILEKIPPEDNLHTRNWCRYGIKSLNAADSQGLIELSTQFCYKKQCLNCNIGTELLLKTNQDPGGLF